jgi:hypothetical protein
MKFDWRGYTKRFRENWNVVRICPIWLLPLSLYMKLKSNKDYCSTALSYRKCAITWTDIYELITAYIYLACIRGITMNSKSLELFSRFITAVNTWAGVRPIKEVNYMVSACCGDICHSWCAFWNAASTSLVRLGKAWMMLATPVLRQRNSICVSQGLWSSECWK